MPYVSCRVMHTRAKSECELVKLLSDRIPRAKLRDGVKKSKWKFKMAFAMKGGRGLEGVSSATYLF